MFIIVGQNYIGVIFASAIKGIGSAGIASTMFAIVQILLNMENGRLDIELRGL